MRPRYLLLATLTSTLTLACGDSGSATGSASTTGSTSAASTGETGTGTTVTSGASAEPTTGLTGGMTTGSEATTAVTTGTTGMTGTTGTTGATGTTTEGSTTEGSTGTTATTGAGSSTGGESSTGGGEGFLPCETDQDCTLADGCCDCEPLNPGETVPKCDVPECLVSACTSLGLDDVGVECRLGRCMFVKQTCNPIGVTCNMAPPPCGVGDVPGVEDTNEGKCWTGGCVPAEACDWVPDCSYCEADDLVCVTKLQKGLYKVCEAKPLDCGDSENIDCTCGQQVCDASPPHTVCHDLDEDIGCECPFC